MSTTTTENQNTTDPTTKVRRDLAEIIDLSIRLLTQAVHDANAQIDGTSLPGGRAMIALASVGDVETFERRVELTEAAWFARAVRDGGVRLADGVTVVLDDSDRPSVGVDEDDDSAPALQIIRYWSERYRWQLGMAWDHIPTLQTEAAFLRNPDVLSHIAEHHAADWPHMAQEINRARRHLEDVLYAGKRPDRSRVVCNSPGCESPKTLIMVHAPRYIVARSCVACDARFPEVLVCDECGGRAAANGDRVCPRTRRGGLACTGTLHPTTDVPDHCPNIWCATVAPPAPIWASNDTDDRWKCTSCKQWYDDERRKRAYADQLLVEGADRFVRLPEAVDSLKYLGRSARTVRKWLESPIQHVDDRCTECARTWPPGEHNVCPGLLPGSLEPCGGELVQVLAGDPEDVVGGYCEIGTRRVWVWWPDLRDRHHNTKVRKRPSA